MELCVFRVVDRFFSLQYSENIPTAARSAVICSPHCQTCGTQGLEGNHRNKSQQFLEMIKQQ